MKYRLLKMSDASGAVYRVQQKFLFLWVTIFQHWFPEPAEDYYRKLVRTNGKTAREILKQD